MPDHHALSIEEVQFLIRSRIRLGWQSFWRQPLPGRRTLVRHDPGFLRGDTDMATADSSNRRVAACVVCIKAGIDDPDNRLGHCRSGSRGKESGTVPPDTALNYAHTRLLRYRRRSHLTRQFLDFCDDFIAHRRHTGIDEKNSVLTD